MFCFYIIVRFICQKWQAQFDENYGKNNADSIIGYCATQIIFRCDGPEIAVEFEYKMFNDDIEAFIAKSRMFFPN